MFSPGIIVIAKENDILAGKLMPTLLPPFSSPHRVCGSSQIQLCQIVAILFPFCNEHHVTGNYLWEVVRNETDAFHVINIPTLAVGSSLLKVLWNVPHNLKQLFPAFIDVFVNTFNLACTFLFVWLYT